jgi:hypothetical protein
LVHLLHVVQQSTYLDTANVQKAMALLAGLV